jgi:uncharacterized protein (TIGR03067 family)
MARIWAIVWVLLPAVTIAIAAPALKEKPPKEPPIVGDWVRVDHTQAGTPVGPDHSTHHQIFSADGGWEYYYGDPKGTTRGNSFVTDTRQSPPTIDIHLKPAGQGTPNWRGIYKVEGDTLTLCLVTGDRDRPKTFESSAQQPTTVWVFKRVKTSE